METALYKIKGKVRHYEWGGYSFIPSFLGDAELQEKPSAEYWLGVHPNDPAEVVSVAGEMTTLNELQEQLGDTPLPFLMKLLDVRMMLSIQVHPSKALAIAGFAREQEAGIAATAPNRTYKDDNHKPELMVALSDFWMLHGLRSEPELRADFQRRPSCALLLDILENEGMTGLVTAAVSKNDPAIKSITSKLIEAARASSEVENKSSHDFWIRRWTQENPSVDRGILMILLMNLVNLRTGEAIYQPDGLIHAYLEGRNIEIMANSDNVLRAGLTNKHIDAPELLRISRLDATNPDDFKINAIRNDLGIRSFDTPFEDFHLQDLEVSPQGASSFESKRSQILLFNSGDSIEVSDGATQFELVPGEACYARKGSQLEIVNSSYRTAQLFIGS